MYFQNQSLHIRVRRWYYIWLSDVHLPVHCISHNLFKQLTSVIANSGCGGCVPIWYAAFKVNDSDKKLVGGKKELDTETNVWSLESFIRWSVGIADRR